MADIHLRLSADLHATLKSIADAELRSVNSLVRMAINSYLQARTQQGAAPTPVRAPAPVTPRVVEPPAAQWAAIDADDDDQSDSWPTD